MCAAHGWCVCWEPGSEAMKWSLMALRCLVWWLFCKSMAEQDDLGSKNLFKCEKNKWQNECLFPKVWKARILRTQGWWPKGLGSIKKCRRRSWTKPKRKLNRDNGSVLPGSAEMAPVCIKTTGTFWSCSYLCGHLGDAIWRHIATENIPPQVGVFHILKVRDSASDAVLVLHVGVLELQEDAYGLVKEICSKSYDSYRKTKMHRQYTCTAQAPHCTQRPALSLRILKGYIPQSGLRVHRSRPRWWYGHLMSKKVLELELMNTKHTSSLQTKLFSKDKFSFFRFTAQLRS